MLFSRWYLTIVLICTLLTRHGPCHHEAHNLLGINFKNKFLFGFFMLNLSYFLIGSLAFFIHYGY